MNKKCNITIRSLSDSQKSTIEDIIKSNTLVNTKTSALIHALDYYDKYTEMRHHLDEAVKDRLLLEKKLAKLLDAVQTITNFSKEN